MGRPLEINLLHTFVIVVEEQSVTRVAGRIDVALVTRMPNVASITMPRHEPLVWLGAQSGTAFQEDTLPLALLFESNICRDYALQALSNVGRAWRVSFVSESIAEMKAMALADATVIDLAESVRETGLRRLTERGIGNSSAISS